MKRVFFVGAGGVGKTSVLELLAQKLTSMGVQTEVFKSVSRDFFKAKGITTEQAGLERPEADRFQFQSELFDFYCQRLLDEMQSMRERGVEVMIADRSPYDHLAYLIYNTPNILDYDQMWSKVKQAETLLLDGTIEHRDRTAFVFFPCTGKWMTPSIVNDGVRHAPPSKNYTVSCLMEGLLSTVGEPTYFLDPESSVAVRADQILDTLGYSNG